MSDKNEYDPFASPQPQPGMFDPSSSPGRGYGVAQPGFIAPDASPHRAPAAPSGQPGMGNFVPMPMPMPTPMSPPPYGYGAAPSTGSGQKNYLGILSLIFPFVSLSLVGIIMGHLGLSAVKKGTANNRGIALAGTIISWVVTGLSLVGILAAIAIPVYLNQQDRTHEAAAKSDLRMLQIAVASHFVDHTEPPVVTIAGADYVIGDHTEPKSASVEDVELVMTGDVAFCVGVTYDGGQELSLTETGTMTAARCPAVSAQRDPQPGMGTSAAVVAFSELASGDCIADPSDNVVEDADGTSWIEGVVIADCSQVHYGEVYAVGNQEADTYIEDDVYAQADDFCYVAFERYMGISYEDSMYYYESYYPTAVSWNYGDRETTCVVTSDASDTVGTLQGSGR